jgi:hypothetical protein
MNKNHARGMKTSIHGLKRTLTTDPALSANFNINELESALNSNKPGTAAGFDGVHPEFIRDCGERPKLFKRAKIIAIPKLSKDVSDPAHYRPISLLSVMYKLLERLILQRIQPPIEAATPVH